MKLHNLYNNFLFFFSFFSLWVKQYLCVYKNVSLNLLSDFNFCKTVH